MADELDGISPETHPAIPDAIIASLREVYTTEGAIVWLYSRNRMLDMERPADLLKSEAGKRRVLDLVYSLGGMVAT